MSTALSRELWFLSTHFAHVATGVDNRLSYPRRSDCVAISRQFGIAVSEYRSRGEFQRTGRRAKHLFALPTESERAHARQLHGTLHGGREYRSDTCSSGRKCPVLPSISGLAPRQSYGVHPIVQSLSRSHAYAMQLGWSGSW